MAAFNSTSRRRGLLAFSLLTLLLAAIVGIGLSHVVAVNSLDRVGGAVARLGMFASLFRGVLIGALALGWPRLLAWLQRSGRLSISEQAVWLAARWRIVGWLLIIELLLGQQLLSHVVRAWNGSA
jgi:hypothetical protein